MEISINPNLLSRWRREADEETGKAFKCSGSMIPDTNVGGNIATINEGADDQGMTFFFS